MSVMLDDATRAVLAYRVEGEAARVREEFGKFAFVVSREAIAAHEASHAVVGTAEVLRVVRVQVFDQPQPARPGAFSFDETWCGLTTSRGSPTVSMISHPADDLRHARMTIAGRVGEVMSPHGRLGAAIGELVLARWLTDLAAKKLQVDGERLWRTEVRRPVRRILRLNQGVVDAIAERLLSVGRVRGWRLREILEDVRRLDGDRP